VTIQQVRELLGNEAESLTDSQVEKIKKAGRLFAEAAYLLMEQDSKTPPLGTNHVQAESRSNS